MPLKKAVLIERSLEEQRGAEGEAEAGPRSAGGVVDEIDGEGELFGGRGTIGTGKLSDTLLGYQALMGGLSCQRWINLRGQGSARWIRPVRGRRRVGPAPES